MAINGTVAHRQPSLSSTTHVSCNLLRIRVRTEAMRFTILALMLVESEAPPNEGSKDCADQPTVEKMLDQSSCVTERWRGRRHTASQESVL